MTDQMQTEWEIWQGVMKEFRSAFKVDPNGMELNVFWAAVRRWGEELVALRGAQEPHVRFRALTGARERYPGEKT